MDSDDPVTIRDYFLALRAADKELREADRQFHVERDRRYTELAEEREKRLVAAQEEVRAWRANANEWRGAMNDREKRFVTWGGVVGLVATAAAIISMFMMLKG